MSGQQAVEKQQDEFTPSNDTEKDILDGIDIDPVGGSGANKDDKTGAEEGSGDASSGKTEGQGSGQPAPTGAGNPVDGSKPGQQQPAPAAPAELKSDVHGNLVDGKGTIVHKAGSERRLYEKSQQLVQAVQLKDRHIASLQEQLKGKTGDPEQTKVLNGMPAQLGLNPNETVSALQLLSKWKKDPTEAVKYLLTEYAALGYDVNKMLGKESSGIDTAAIQTMIQQAIGPIKADRDARQSEERWLQEAKQEATAFLAKYPDAATHEQDLATLLDRDANLTPEAAYFQLKSWCLENQFDFTKPLKPQVLARQGGTQQPANQQSGNGVAPMPNGRGTPTNVQPNTGMASEKSEWSDIVREEMSKAGIR